MSEFDFSSEEGIRTAQAARDESGQRLYETSAKHRHTVEQARFALAKGEAPPAPQVAAFDADMREKGIQRPVAAATEQPAAIVPDQRGLEFMQQWRRDNPRATTEQLAIWEKDVASFMSGRVLGETLAAFEARQRGAVTSTPAGSVALNGAEFDDDAGIQRVSDAASELHVRGDVLTGVLEAVARVADADQTNEQWSDTPRSLFNYTISPEEIGGPGFSLDFGHNQLHVALRECAKKGLNQRQVVGLMRAYFQNGEGA